MLQLPFRYEVGKSLVKTRQAVDTKQEAVKSERAKIYLMRLSQRLDTVERRMRPRVRIKGKNVVADASPIQPAEMLELRDCLGEIVDVEKQAACI